jgi:hypothetical protein
MTVNGNLEQTLAAKFLPTSLTIQVENRFSM